MKLSALAAQIKNCGHCEVINNGGRIFVGTGSAFYCMDGYPRTQDAGELGAMLGIPQKKMKNIFYHEEWQYIEDTAISNDPAVLWPAAASTRAGSGTGVKAGFFVKPAAFGVRAAWRCCTLYDGGNASLAAAYSSYWVGSAHWNGGAGVPDLAG